MSTKTHGHTQGYRATRVYTIWRNMLARCRNPKHAYFADYGGRGIEVCERWYSFEHFLLDMGEPPKKRSLGRINNDRGYSPDNCEWQTHRKQMRNTRSTRFFEYKGRRYSLPELAEMSKISPSTLRNRLVYWDWSVEDAVEQRPTFGRGRRGHKRSVEP